MAGKKYGGEPMRTHDGAIRVNDISLLEHTLPSRKHKASSQDTVAPNVSDCFPSLFRLFYAEDGYTTISVAVALLLSLSLIFSLANIHSMSTHAADVQEVADACALAGSNCVAAFSTIVQVLDACVLSLGLCGMIVLAVGIVVSAIPFLRVYAAPIISAAHHIFQARATFAKSAYTGVAKLEQALPYIIAYNSASCAYANNTQHSPYVGMAIAYPFSSQSDFSALTKEIDDTNMAEDAKKLEESTQKQEEAQKKADEAKKRAWEADCVDKPSCMKSRVSKLSHIPDTENPSYTLEAWNFEYARMRALKYYQTRATQELPHSKTPDEYVRSCARKKFYMYAYAQLLKSHCNEDEPVDIALPMFPHNRKTLRATTLYTQKMWPCCSEGGKLVAYCDESKCPTSPSVYVSLQDIERGHAKPASQYGMSLKAMGSVASASTHISNGFEHYWKKVVEASAEYQDQMKKIEELEQTKETSAQDAHATYESALQALALGRPTFCPPGAYGCIAFVTRPSQLHTPDLLGNSFSSSATLPAGIALGAACLAPDEHTDNNDVLVRMADAINAQQFPLAATLIGNICSLWSGLLSAYGSAYANLSSFADDIFAGISDLGGSRVAGWLKSKISETIGGFGFEPVDLRVRKPVRVNSRYILARAGKDGLGELRSWITELPRDPTRLKAQIKEKIYSILGKQFTMADLPILGGSGSIPLSIDIDRLL